MRLTKLSQTVGLNSDLNRFNPFYLGSSGYCNDFMYCSYSVVGKCVYWLEMNEKKLSFMR